MATIDHTPIGATLTATAMNHAMNQMQQQLQISTYGKNMAMQGLSSLHQAEKVPTGPRLYNSDRYNLKTKFRIRINGLNVVIIEYKSKLFSRWVKADHYDITNVLEAAVAIKNLRDEILKYADSVAKARKWKTVSTT